MLEKLDLIDWNNVTPFFGDRNNIPQQIRDLASLHPEIREKGRSLLYDEVLLHQGTICNATVCTVPFLIELLDCPAVEDKNHIISFLISLIIEEPYDLNHPLEYRKDNYSGEDYFLVYLEVRDNCLVYKKLMCHNSSIVRLEAAYLLGLFPEFAEQNSKWLKLHFDSNETDEWVRSTIIFAVGLLAKDREEDIAWLQNIFDRENTFSLRINAAIALARSNPDRVSASVIDLLVELISNPGDLALSFDRFPWMVYRPLISGNLPYWCGVALTCVGKCSTLVIPALIKALESVSIDGSFDIISCILHIIFDGKPISPTLTLEQLSDEQHTGLHAIANHRQFWTRFEENDRNNDVIWLLKSFDLHISSEQLQAFLAGELKQLPIPVESEIPF